MTLLNQCISRIAETKKKQEYLCTVNLSSQELNNVESVYPDLEDLGYAFQPISDGLEIWNLYPFVAPPEVVPEKREFGNLTKEQCAEIIRIYGQGVETQRSLGLKFKKHTSTIAKVLCYKITGKQIGQSYDYEEQHNFLGLVLVTFNGQFYYRPRLYMDKNE